MTTIQVRIHGDSMWPTLRDGDCVKAETDRHPAIGSIVVAKHPWKEIHIVKRVKEILPDGFFLEGDNPDPTGTEDSHNFGPIPSSSIIGIIIE
tara:strand:- start:692 stop:970 length:279 start_codon:yes stop_codon:yes gene_type:complete